MNRHVPLRATATLRRRTPLTAVSARRLTTRVAGLIRRRPAPAVPAGLRQVLAARSGGWCEMQLHGCLGRASDPAHRLARKTGGRHRGGRALVDRLSAVLHACRTCHDWSEARPAESYEQGLKIREGQDPLREPVTYRGVLAYLDDAGGVQPAEDRWAALHTPVPVAAVGGLR